MDKTKTTCAVDDCGKPVKSRGWCYGHYMKWWRYGTTHPEHKLTHYELEGQRFNELTVIKWVDGRWLCSCSCGSECRARSYELTTGLIKTCGARRRHLSADVGYGTAHERVRAFRGSAAEHMCVDCGGNAAQWSYNHSDPEEIVSTESYADGLPYSVDPSYYDPRCVSCHKRFDLARI